MTDEHQADFSSVYTITSRSTFISQVSPIDNNHCNATSTGSLLLLIFKTSTSATMCNAKQFMLMVYSTIEFLIKTKQ